jgi:hypothetical protein
MARRPCQGPCGRNRDEKFFVSARGRICVDCQKQKRSKSTHARRVEDTYGLSSEDYDRLLEYQGGGCAICGGKRKYRLNVDHCHKSGLVRGLLCRRCNKLLRDVRDNCQTLAGAIAYLTKTPAAELGIVAVAKENRA